MFPNYDSLHILCFYSNIIQRFYIYFTGTKVKGKFGGLTAGGLIGVIIAVVIVLALPTIGLILWKRKNSNSSNPGSIGFENSTYQYNTKQENGQFVAEQNSTETES